MKKFFSVKKSQKVKIKTVKIMNKIKIKMTNNNGIMEQKYIMKTLREEINN